MSGEQAHRSDLKGLLRFLLDHTKSEDAQESKCQEMDPEKKKFLESALSCMTTDVINEFQIAISILDDRTSEVTEKLNALNTIRESIDDIDFANSFVKAGGSVYLIELLSSTDTKLKSTSACIIAEMSQNNPFCQKYFVDAKTIPVLVTFLNESPEVASSGLLAISSLLQNFEPGLIEFLNVDGISISLTCLSKNDSKMVARACFFIGKLAEHGELRDELVKKSAIVELIDCLPRSFVKYENYLETGLFALSELSKSNKWIIDKEHEEKLRTLTSSIVENSKNEAEYEEIYGYACTILHRLDK